MPVLLFLKQERSFAASCMFYEMIYCSSENIIIFWSPHSFRHLRRRWYCRCRCRTHNGAAVNQSPDTIFQFWWPELFKRRTDFTRDRGRVGFSIAHNEWITCVFVLFSAAMKSDLQQSDTQNRLVWPVCFAFFRLHLFSFSSADLSPSGQCTNLRRRKRDI